MNLIRKLGNSELSFNHDAPFNTFINSRCILLQSKFNLYENIDNIKQAIVFWKQCHHFLRCKISKININNDKHEKYFEYIDKEKLNNFDNVKFLNYSNSTAKMNDFWKVIFERELQTEFNCENELLWRLIFIKYEEDAHSNDGFLFSYRVIFTIHHAITDGRNACSILCQLIQIIENVYLNQQVEIMNYTVESSFEEKVVCSISNLSTMQLKTISKFEDYELHENLRPKENLNNNSSNISQYGNFYCLDSSLFASHEQLTKLNRKDTYACIEQIVFNEHELPKLYFKCKSRNIKLASCFNLISILATRILLSSYECTKDVNTPIDYLLTVSLRSHLEPPLSNYIMGYYSTYLYFKYNFKLDTNDKNFWNENIWNAIKNESDMIHEHLKVIKQIQYKSLISNEYDVIDKRGDDFRTLVHFVMSNMGDISSICQTKNKFLNVTEHFAAMGRLRTESPAIFFHSICTIDNNLCWGVTYNNRFVSKQAIHFYINTIKDIVKKLIE